jgi:hypothetical protein
MRHYGGAMTDTQFSAAGMRAGTPAPPRSPDSPAPLRTRLQLALAGLWLLDGLLQFQPYMFTKNFATQTLMGVTTGNPGWIATPVNWSAQIIENHPVSTNTAFAAIQVALGLGIAHPRTRRAALGCSAVWAASVWYFGEGLGGLFTGTANPLTGAPGSVVMYALLAVLLWECRRTDVFPAAAWIGEHAAKLVWSAFWLGMSYLTLLPVNRAPGAFSDAMTGGMMTEGEPSWFTTLAGHAAKAVEGHDLAVAIVLAALQVLIAACVWAPRRNLMRAGLIIAAVLGLAYWVFGQAFGMPFMGMATDPNTGPLLVLLAAAYWPQRSATGIPGAQDTAGAGIDARAMEGAA